MSQSLSSRNQILGHGLRSYNPKAMKMMEKEVKERWEVIKFLSLLYHTGT